MFDVGAEATERPIARKRIVISAVFVAAIAAGAVVAVLSVTGEEPSRATPPSTVTAVPSRGPATTTQAGDLRLCFSGSARKVDVTQSFGKDVGAPHLSLDNGQCLGIQSVRGGVKVSVKVVNAGARGDVGCSIELAGVQLVSRAPEQGRRSVTCSARI